MRATRLTSIELALIVNSALYLAACIAAGLATGNRVAWTLAILDAGVLYLGYLAGASAPKIMSGIAGKAWLVLTVIFGALAGIALLIP